MRLYNTLSRTVEELEPLHAPTITFYSCGPTVYDNTHIGHLRTFVNNDLLKRTLTLMGFSVNHVMNITDVGHLTGDDDSGEDKLEKGAKRAGKSVWDVAKSYTDQFLSSIQAVNIILPAHLAKATDHIDDMIALIKKLQEKGFTYETDEAIYFDISKFKDYGALSKQSLDEKQQGSREEVHTDPQKKHPADFALWFKRVGRFEKHEMHWPFATAQGKAEGLAPSEVEGFPGWHIECSTMSMKYLGETIDIHSGGIDHIPVHHENEIAQSEAATGKPFVRSWFHSAFLTVNGEKMSKSLNNFYTVTDVSEKGFEPLSLRYLFLLTHYRKPLNFTWESLESAAQAYTRLREMTVSLKSEQNRTILSEEKLSKVDAFRSEFTSALENDLNMPSAVATMWSMLKSNIPSEDKYDLLIEFDRVLGLGLAFVSEDEIPAEITKLAEERQKARDDKDFARSDDLRQKIDEAGYSIEDQGASYRLKKK